MHESVPLQVNATQNVEARICERLHIGGHISYRRLLEDLAGMGFSSNQVGGRGRGVGELCVSYVFLVWHLGLLRVCNKHELQASWLVCCKWARVAEHALVATPSASCACMRVSFSTGGVWIGVCGGTDSGCVSVAAVCLLALPAGWVSGQGHDQQRAAAQEGRGQDAGALRSISLGLRQPGVVYAYLWSESCSALHVYAGMHCRLL